jgi:hypothetical protein
METLNELEIRRMPDGGYLVSDAFHRSSGMESFRQMRFAATSIEEALKYIKGKLGQQTAK